MQKQKSLYYLKKLLFFLKPYKFRILTAFISMIVVSSTTGAIAYIVKPIMNHIFVNKDKTYLFLLPIIIIVIFLIRGIFEIFQDYQMKYTSLKILEEIRSALYKKIIKLPLEFFDQSQVGMLMSRMINDVENIRRSFPQMISFLKRILTVLFLIGVAYHQSFLLASCATVVLPLIAVPIYIINKKLRRFSRKRQSKLADMSSILQEVFSSMNVIKSSASEEREVAKFDKENKRLLKITLKREMINTISGPILEVCTGIGLALVVVFGGAQVINGQMSPGDLFSFITAISLIFNPLTKIGDSNVIIQEALVGAERVFAILESPDILEEEEGKEILVGPLKELKFKNVYFTYATGKEPALKNINFTIHNGERIAIVGPSGSGKSTIVKLITRFYKPDSGEILINNRNISDFTLNSLRSFITIVTQNSTLFNVSIRDNISYGLEKYSDEDIIRVAKIAYAHEFIEQLPEGYNTIVGERGSKLSEGQKQRIIIARALLKNPELLILDEATSALDMESEYLVRKALENLLVNRTAIIIAHRLTTILNANRILVINKGEIVDMGVHNELLNRCPLYKKLYELEFTYDTAHIGKA
jgi:subfamily B ATP-binding cassette protein MsbA